MPDLRHQLQVMAMPTAVFPLVATSVGLAKWWAADSRDIADPTSGVELGFFNRRTVYRLRPLTFVSPTVATWRCETGQEWNNTVLSFTLQPQESGTLLRFVHGAWAADTDYFVSCNTVWGALLFRLKAAAEGHPQGPLFTADATAY
jgi:uncharacterized protein YndB with AHSA1/START domain